MTSEIEYHGLSSLHQEAAIQQIEWFRYFMRKEHSQLPESAYKKIILGHRARRRPKKGWV